MNVYHDDNHEFVQPFDEIVSMWVVAICNPKLQFTYN